ncbi:hypothetical protein PTQ21_12260 [Paenibacillus marchantiae]|uniref:hypothetical protein n=1 Tax=Paenibacillus marchantiae TaxID=3026433 RepID=UPI00237B5B7B|nr:hypothetical protein [Paenibacillus marchantiae]WDQ34963.1 hypothetical protein PTQ21_12260 [Paenibacillus marchantiae]
MIKENYAKNLNDDERNVIWRQLNQQGEIEYVFNYTEKLADSLSDPSKTRSVNREDRLNLEEWYAKMELALKKMKDNNNYSLEVKAQYLDRYNKCIELAGHINQRSISD